MEYVSVLWWATWVARWFLEWTLLDVCQYWSLAIHDKMLLWSRLAVIWRESKRFPNVPNGVTKGFTDVLSNIWMHHRASSALMDFYATWKYVTPITVANKRSLDIKNGQFSHFLIFFFVTERCRRKTLRRGRLKGWISRNGIITQRTTTTVSHLPNFAVKGLRTDVWSSFTVRHYSMFIDVYTFSSEVERHLFWW